MGIHSYSLAFADRVRIAYPTAAPLLDQRTRRARGRHAETTVELRGQYEPSGEKRRNAGALGADEDTRAVLLLDVAECARAGYTPAAEGHRLVQVMPRETGIARTLNVYIVEPTQEGNRWRCVFEDRQPARRGS